MGPFAACERIQRAAQLQNFSSFQPRIIANVKAVKMNMFGLREIEMMALRHDLFQIWLADLVAAAWADTLTRYHIPRHYALQLIDGVARDLSQSRYQTFDELATYCYGVASTVGLMSMYIVGFTSHEAVPYAIKLGVALQMTNILRDVGEDFRNGRIYLPQDELRAFGITEADIAHGSITDRWRDFMRFQIDRTRRLYAESSPGIRLLDPDGQLAIAAASGLYRGILDTIEKNGCDVFSRRASLSAWEKIARIPALYLELQRTRRGHPVVRDLQLA